MVVYGIFAMILTGISWTITGYVMGRAPRHNIRISHLMILTSLLTFIISLCIGIIQGFPRLSPSGYLVTFGALLICGIADYFQLDFMSRAMQRGPNGIIWSIVQSGFIFPFFMGVIFFGVQMNIFRTCGLVSLLLSLTLFGTGKNTFNGKNWKLPAFAAFLMTGIMQSLNNLPSYFTESESVTSIWRTAAFAAGMGIGAILAELPGGGLSLNGIGTCFRRLTVWQNVALLEIPQLVSSYLLLYPGMDILSKAGIGSAAYPVMVASCIIFFELFTITVFHEKRKPLQWLALILCLIGVTGICL